MKWAVGNIVRDGNGYKIGEETDRGAYASWGNVVPHFSSNGSAFDDGYSFDSTTYNSTSGSSLSVSINPNSGYDICRTLLGGKWRMPTMIEYQELCNNCTSSIITKNGIQGTEFTSNINGNKVFFGNYSCAYGGSNLLYSYGSYWSSTVIDSGSAYNLVSSTPTPNDSDPRCYGLLIRAVIS